MRRGWTLWAHCGCGHVFLLPIGSEQKCPACKWPTVYDGEHGLSLSSKATYEWRRSSPNKSEGKR